MRLHSGVPRRAVKVPAFRLAGLAGGFQNFITAAGDFAPVRQMAARGLSCHCFDDRQFCINTKDGDAYPVFFSPLWAPSRIE